MRSRIFILPLLFFVLLLPLIGTSELTNSAEAREAHVARAMMETGNYILPLRAGHVPSKPPLFHWAVAAFSLPAGDVSPFTARLPSLVAAALTVFATMLFCAFNFGSEAAVLSGIILSTTYGFTGLAGKAMVDQVFSFFAVTAMLIACRACAAIEPGDSLADRLGSKQLIPFFAACAFAVVGKGPLGLALPALLLAALLWMNGRANGAASLAGRSLPALVVFAAIAVPWYLAAMRSGGDRFVWRQVIFENVDRFWGGTNVNTESWWFYVPSFFRTAAPWSLLFIFIWFKHSPKRPEVKALLAWFVIGMLLFSASSGKRHSYLLPLYPAVSAYLAGECAEAPIIRIIEAWLAKAGYFAAIMLGLAVIAILYTALSARVGVSYAPWIREHATALLFVVLFGVMCWRLLGGALSSWSSIFTALAIITYGGVGIKNYLHDYDRIAAQVAREVPPDAELSVLRTPEDGFFDPVLFYLRRGLRTFGYENIPATCPGYVLATDSWLASPERGAFLASNARVIDTYSILARKAGTAGQVVLLSCD